MQPVQFKCGHCNNLMAVGPEFLGQQVRCPHCQQVVVAPAPQPAAAPAEAPKESVTVPAEAPPAPEFTVPSASEQDSIFEPMKIDDDLFAAPPPKVEVPAGPAPDWMQPAADWPAPAPGPAPLPEPERAPAEGNLGPTVTLPPPPDGP